MGWGFIRGPYSKPRISRISMTSYACASAVASRSSLTHAVRCWRHCCTAHVWWYGLPSLHQKQSWISCILYRQCQLQNPYLDKLFWQIIVFISDLEWVFAERYLKLQYFVTILSLVTLQGSVCTYVRWNFAFCISHNTHWWALISLATCQIW